MKRTQLLYIKWSMHTDENEFTWKMITICVCYILCDTWLSYLEKTSAQLSNVMSKITRLFDNWMLRINFPWNSNWICTYSISMKLIRNANISWIFVNESVIVCHQLYHFQWCDVIWIDVQIFTFGSLIIRELYCSRIQYNVKYSVQ